MSLQRMAAIARKEFLHVFRDARSLGMAIVIPMLLLTLFGYALTLDVDRVPLLVWDQSQTVASRDLVSRFSGSRYFSLLGYAHNYQEISRAIASGEAMMALVVRREFAADLQANRPTSAQLIVDGSDANTATLAIGYAETVTHQFSQDFTLEKLSRWGQRDASLPLDVRPRVWFNADMQSKNFIVPGLIAVIMMVIAALLTSLTVAREWERGTMEQLIATPVKGPELILGKLAPYFAIGLFDVLLAVLMGEFLFHVPLRGSLLLLFLMTAVFLAGTLSMGVLISVVAKNQLVACQLAMVTTFLPGFLLSGFMIPIANMPAPVQVVTYAVPARYFVVLLRAIYLKGVGLEAVPAESLLLAAFGGLMLLLACLRFKKKLV